MKKISVIDSHTGGEPTRLVLSGFPDLGEGPLAERLQTLRNDFDQWRTACMLEPRGNEVLVGALLCKPVDPEASAGVIFFNDTGYLAMCGHGTIGLVASLAYLGRIGPGKHRIETPAGTVEAELAADGAVSVRNVPAYRFKKAVTVDVPGFGAVTGDIAWGGNWFFLISRHGQSIEASNTRVLTEYAMTVRAALAKAGIRGANGAVVDHIELFADGLAGRDTFDSRSFVLCPGTAYDRSPCGTGTSAKLACLAADDVLAPGEVWRQASVIGSQFEASYIFGESRDLGERSADDIDPSVTVTLRGRAYVTAETTLIVDDERDPFAWGIAAEKR